jgi:hypothetical protein
MYVVNFLRWELVCALTLYISLLDLTPSAELFE